MTVVCLVLYCEKILLLCERLWPYFIVGCDA